MFYTQEELNTIDKWHHKYPAILKSGRTSHYIPSHRDEEKADELKDLLDEKDKIPDLLTVLSEDVENIWNIKYYGQKWTYT